MNRCSIGIELLSHLIWGSTSPTAPENTITLDWCASDQLYVFHPDFCYRQRCWTRGERDYLVPRCCCCTLCCCKACNETLPRSKLRLGRLLDHHSHCEHYVRMIEETRTNKAISSLVSAWSQRYLSRRRMGWASMKETCCPGSFRISKRYP